MPGKHGIPPNSLLSQKTRLYASLTKTYSYLPLLRQGCISLAPPMRDSSNPYVIRVASSSQAEIGNGYLCNLKCAAPQSVQ